MIKRILRTGAAAILTTALASPALGQLAPGMDGRANDASNLVGSGGYNPTTGPAYINSANLYVTGNATRGSFFRGNSPIRSTTSLFTALPSSGIGDFERDAIDLNTIITSPTPWLATPYYNPYQTVVPLSAIRAGQNIPGSPIPRDPYLMPRALNSAPLQVNPLDAGATTRPLAGVAPNSSIYTADNLSSLRGTDLYDRLRQADQTRRLQDSAVFGQNRFANEPLVQEAAAAAARAQNVDSFALDLGDAARLRAQPLTRNSRTAQLGAGRSALDSPGLMTPDLLTPAALAPKLLGGDEAVRQRDALTGRPVTGADSGAIATATTSPLSSQPIGPSAIPSQLPPGGTDLDGRPPRPQTGFAIPTGEPTGQEEALASADAFPHLGAAGADPLANLNSAVVFLDQVEDSPELRQRIDATPTLRAQYDRALNVVRSASTDTLHSLAADNDTRVGEVMRAAETKSRAGDYYQASTLYGLAADMDPANPLIQLGHAHALAAAGEYVTAALTLQQAIGNYPSFGFLRLDLNEFVRDPKDLDLRRADLEQRLEKREDYRLRFLLGYIEYYSGFERFGLPNLRKAAQEAPADSTIARFPEILSSPAKYLPERTEIPEAPATNP